MTAPVCACGCGDPVTVYRGVPRKFRRGHCQRGQVRRGPKACPICGSTFRPPRGSTKTCSKRCGGILASRDRLPAVGRYRGAGGGKYEHRVVAERILGRPLLTEEEIHHIDRDRSNNDPSNLMLFANHAEHMRFHRDGGRVVSLADQT